MVRKVLGSMGMVAFVLMALLPMTSWAGSVDITLGSTGNGEPNRMYIETRRLYCQTWI
jgi:hypothetical protein